MPFMEWSNELSVGIGSIDRQHQALVGYLNRLHEGLAKGSANDDLKHVLAGLNAYATAHFLFEEMMFDGQKWPGSENHKKLHVNLSDKVADFTRRFNGGDPTVGPALLDFLKDWLLSHIVKQDKQGYAKYFAENKITVS